MRFILTFANKFYRLKFSALNDAMWTACSVDNIMKLTRMSSEWSDSFRSDQSSFIKNTSN